MSQPRRPTADDCVTRLREASAALARDGASCDTLVEAHVRVAIEAGWKSRRPEAVFDVGQKAFTDAAYSAYEQAKKERATKRRKALGLPEA